MTDLQTCEERPADCQGLHSLRTDFIELRRDMRSDYSRHQTFIAAIVAIGSVLFGSFTQWQIAKLNKVSVPQPVTIVAER